MSLFLEHVSQQFDQTLALNDINLEIKDSEFIAILGPSGCGKTTLLRTIGGFIEPTHGIIRLNDEIYSGQGKMVPVEQRDLGMVFQSFALWPHMTVEEHVAFPLKSKRQQYLSAQEKAQAIEHTLTTLGLKPFANRLPGELSGGQRQRVSLARAIVSKPSILLMDEPLSALDAELKISMRQEIQNIHRLTGAIIIYVTHDQSEALAMANRIIVMKNGAIEQIGTPQEIYTSPQTNFVATFVSKSNLLKGSWQKDIFTVANFKQSNGQPIQYEGPQITSYFKTKGLYPIRPEQFQISRQKEGLPAQITNRQYNGREIHYSVNCGDSQFTVFTNHTDVFNVGDQVYLHFSPT